jgi:hypothetical protein
MPAGPMSTLFGSVQRCILLTEFLTNTPSYQLVPPRGNGAVDRFNSVLYLLICAIAHPVRPSLRAMIEKFLASARRQASMMLREVGLRREFVRRAREAHSRFSEENRGADALDFGTAH